MDRAKFKFPRSPCMSSKELTSFNRPNVDLTACICHGHSVLLCLAEGTVLKDSSWTCEIICYALDTIAARGILDLRMTDVILQADNATKELKNMTMLRRQEPQKSVQIVNQ
ncbi:scrFIAM, partial [Symbiodinium microadriaticum]